MDAIHALEWLRRRCFGIEKESKQYDMMVFHRVNKTYKAIYEKWSTDEYIYGNPQEQIVHTNPRIRFDKVNELIRYRNEYQDHSLQSNSQLKSIPITHITPCLNNPMDKLQELVQEHLDTNNRSPLTRDEQVYLNHLEQMILVFLIQMTIHGGDHIADVHAFFIELVLRQSEGSQSLAFLLLYNLSIAIHEIPMQNELFYKLLEMIDRLVHLGRPIPISTHHVITGCIVAMSSLSDSPGSWIPERIIAFSTESLQVFLQEPHQSSSLIMEILVFGLYLRHAAQMSLDPHETYSRKSRNRFYRSIPLLSIDLSTETPVFDLELNATDHSNLLDFMLAHYFMTPSLVIQHLVFMVFYDIAKGKVQVDRWSSEHGLFQLVQLGMPSAIAATPTLLEDNQRRNFIKRLEITDTETVLSVLGQIAQEMHIDEYFEQSQMLAHVLEKSRYRNGLGSPVTSESATGTTIRYDPLQKMKQLLDSSLLDERFRGHRWLAELLNDSSSIQRDKSVSSLTFMHDFNCDQWHSQRIQARCMFWEGVRAPSMNTRAAMIQVDSTVSAVLRELNAMLKVWVDLNDSTDFVWAVAMQLIVSLCARQLSFVYRRSASKTTDVFDAFDTSVMHSIIRGEVALDRDLLHEISGEIFLAALPVLSTSNVIDPVISGVVALIVKSFYTDVHLFTRAGGLATFRSFLEVPHHAFVSHQIAELIISIVREGSRDVYFETLREMQAVAMEQNDERTLDHSYVHCRQLLARLYHMSKIPID